MKTLLVSFSIFCLLFQHTVWSYETADEKITLVKAQKITLIALDVDGVLTNGEITYTASGDELKVFNVKDGLGLVLASQKGFITAIITGRESSVVERRGKELKVSRIFQNAKDKMKAIEELQSQFHVSLEEICYIGDDLPDIDVLQAVGLSCCPKDAMLKVKEVCTWISSHEGGRGAVRELTDYLLSAKQQNVIPHHP